MFITVAGTPAGYGYFEITATPNENIIPAMVAEIKANDINKELRANISVGTMAIQVKAPCKVSINGRNPVLVEPDIGLTFDARGVFSVVFDTAVAYNITISY
jgi:hypothetical protein|nr:MAG: hypothetical protein [Bacteriophage sp.]DAR68958.1 MAG TPA: hypothetical protein [Caudoviricetes sp.]